MIVNTKWLAKYTDIPFGPQELAERLTFLGLEATVKKSAFDELDGVVIAEITEISDHPNADKLKVCTVTTGREFQKVVCGAPNIAVGQKVPLALVGTTLANGMTLKPVKIRGVRSEGMICAEDELGISDDHSGIVILSEKAPLGVSLRDYFSGEGTILDIDLTPNRPDCASHLGVAREIAILTGKPFQKPQVELTESAESTANNVTIELQNPQGCPRYAARIVKGVTIGPSPDWMVQALQSVGLRSINNVVDAANYVLMETGHPLHTFDYQEIRKQKIVVRSAVDGEEVETLDGVRRELSSDVLLICDGGRPVAVAGIMGLANSEIGADSRDILIESAYFDPVTIRKGSKYLGLSTEASYRFERGADPEGLIYALNRLAQLIGELAGGKILRGIADAYPQPIQLPELTVRYAKVDQLIGTNIKPDWICEKFKQLGCEILDADQNQIKIRVPSWRPDLEREVDMIEEVVRIYGMPNVPTPSYFRIYPSDEGYRRYDQIETLRSILAQFGLYEAYCNSLVRLDWTSFWKTDIDPIRIRNPLSQDMAYLRTSLLPGLIQAARLNINRQNSDLRLFELGNVQITAPQAETRAEERLCLAILLSGYIEDQHWNYQRRAADLFILKGMLIELCERFGITGLKLQKVEHPHFKQLLIVRKDSAEVARLGQLTPKYLKAEWDLEEPLFVLEGDVEVILRSARFTKEYRELPIYPDIQRDISVLVPKTTNIAAVSELIRKHGGAYLKAVKFYDLYQGKNIDKRFKSLTFNLVFQAGDRTLKDEEVDQQMAKIFKELKSRLDARLR